LMVGFVREGEEGGLGLGGERGLPTRSSGSGRGFDHLYVDSRVGLSMKIKTTGRGEKKRKYVVILTQ